VKFGNLRDIPKGFGETAQIIRPSGRSYVPSRALIFYDGGYQSIPARVADKAWWLLGHLKEFLLAASPESVTQVQ
jgi:hypothetical protein